MYTWNEFTRKYKQEIRVGLIVFLAIINEKYKIYFK